MKSILVLSGLLMLSVLAAAAIGGGSAQDPASIEGSADVSGQSLLSRPSATPSAPNLQGRAHMQAIPQPQLQPGSLGKVAFLLDSDIWVSDLPSETVSRLTVGGSMGSLPQTDTQRPELRWSPSGDWLLAAGNVLKADGTLIRTDTGCVSWSPFADELACHAEGHLWLESADGSLRQQLMQDVGPTINIAWSPDGQSIALSVIDQAARDASTIWIAGRDGRSLRLALGSSDLAAQQLIPAFWTPDGGQLFFFAGPFSASIMSDGLGLGMLDLEFGSARILLDVVHLKQDFFGGFLPSGSLVYTNGGGRLMTDGKRIGALDIMTTPALLTENGSAISPALSPDGETIAYTSGKDGDDWGGQELRSAVFSRRIWLMDADGSNKRRLTTSDEYREEHAQWSADGRGLLFTRADASGALSLWYAEPGSPSTATLVGAIFGPEIQAREALHYGYYGYVDWNRYYAWWQPK